MFLLVPEPLNPGAGAGKLLCPHGAHPTNFEEEKDDCGNVCPQTPTMAEDWTELL